MKEAIGLLFLFPAIANPLVYEQYSLSLKKTSTGKDR